MTWVRGGYCCKCGDCCKGVPPGEERPAINGMCPMLIDGENGTRICSVHGSDHAYWNAACRLWPDHPRQIEHLPRCTFTFTLVD